jgi:hypothetical protein
MKTVNQLVALNEMILIPPLGLWHEKAYGHQKVHRLHPLTRDNWKITTTFQF